MIRAVILAAGLSRRMGTQKLLLPWAGRTVIAHIVDQVADDDEVQRVAVVTRAGSGVAEALAGAAAGKLEVVANPDPDADMLSSVRCGLRALEGECEAYLVALGDQPTITTELVRRMIAAQRQSGRGIVVPVCTGRRGHPLLLAAKYREEVLTRFDGVGLRGLADAHGDDVLELDEPDAAVLHDMDFPADYQRAAGNVLKEKLGRKGRNAP